MWRHVIIMPLDGTSVISITQLSNFETNFNFAYSRVSKQAVL